MASVLVVEDNTNVSRFAHRQLEKRGYQVATATTCAAARRLDELGMRFQVALVDVGLPDGDGFTLGEELVASGTVRHVVYYTGLYRDPASARGNAGELSGPIIVKGDDMRAVFDVLGKLARREGQSTDAQAASAADQDGAVSQANAMIVESQDRAGTHQDWLGLPASGDELVLPPDLPMLQGVSRSTGRQEQTHRVAIDELEVNLHLERVWVMRAEVQLTSRPWQALSYLLRNRGRAVSAEELAKKAFDEVLDSSTARDHIGTLRRALSAAGRLVQKTHRGYMIA